MITGTIERILTQKDDDWGRYKIVSDNGEENLCVGIIPAASLHMKVCLDGKNETTKWGRQYNISSVFYAKQDEYAGIRRFLTDGYIKGIGSVKADRLVLSFGSEIFQLFDAEDGVSRLSIIDGINEKAAQTIIKSYQKSKKYKDIVLLLNGACTKNQVEKIYKQYGDKAVEKIRKNPYRLQYDIDGFGFKKADALALASGMKTDNIARLEAGIYFVLKKAESDGDCYLAKEDAISRAIEELSPAAPITVFEKEDKNKITKKIVENAIADWGEKKKTYLTKRYGISQNALDVISEMVHSRKLIKEGIENAVGSAITEGIIISLNGRLYTPEMYEAEKEVAKKLLFLVSRSSVRKITDPEIDKAIKDAEIRKTKGMGVKFTATEEQKEAVRLGLTNRISIISGGPGRGKTAISEMIADAFISAGNGDNKDIVMLAPTGRAAQRITESTGYDSMTAHRAILRSRCQARKLLSEEKDPKEAYPKNKLVLCDETSMVDIFLMRDILSYAQNCNIIFIGDVDQIASVGPGKVLKDMIESKKIPYILLKQGHRNSGTIAENAVRINEGQKIRDYTYDESFTYIPCTKENIANAIVSDYINAVKKYGIEEVMLCTAMRDRGQISVAYLNKRLQAIFTKGKDSADLGGDKVFCVGDRVMQTVNNYRFEKVRNGEHFNGAFNGEKGTIVKILHDAETKEPSIVVRFDDGSIGGYLKDTASQLTLAYATTIHKCQGSETKCMMMAYTFGDYILMNRSLFYTGETRAKKEFRFYGEEQLRYGHMTSAFDLAVKKMNDKKRNTSLAEMLSGQIKIC